jgi:hypothetical protein
MIPQGFVRVSKGKPCPVCSKPDWCLVAKDGSAAICPRLPSNKQIGDAGFLHRLTNDFHPSMVPTFQKPVSIDATGIARRYQDGMGEKEYTSLAEALGVSQESLMGLSVGKADQYLEGTYSFPMRDASDNIIGVRLRNADGHKWAIYGSRSGLFYGSLEHGETIYVCEGPTDTAALMDMGLCGIGKPSCNGGNEILVEIIKKLRPPLVVVIADVDPKSGKCDFCEQQFCQHCHPGQHGAATTAKAISAVGISVKIIEPINAKDLRQWRRNGLTKAAFQAVVNNTFFWSG